MPKYQDKAAAFAVGSVGVALESLTPYVTTPTGRWRRHDGKEKTESFPPSPLLSLTPGSSSGLEVGPLLTSLPAECLRHKRLPPHSLPFAGPLHLFLGKFFIWGAPAPHSGKGKQPIPLLPIQIALRRFQTVLEFEKVQCRYNSGMNQLRDFPMIQKVRKPLLEQRLSEIESSLAGKPMNELSIFILALTLLIVIIRMG